MRRPPAAEGARGRASSVARPRERVHLGEAGLTCARAPLRPAALPAGVPAKAHRPSGPRSRRQGSAPVRDPGDDACRSGTAPGPGPPHPCRSLRYSPASPRVRTAGGKIGSASAKVTRVGPEPGARDLEEGSLGGRLWPAGGPFQMLSVDPPGRASGKKVVSG